MQLPDGVREATPADIPDILRLVHDLAAYEREHDAVRNTPELMEAALFVDNAVASALLAEVDDEVVGIAVWFRTYSTWTGVPGLHLEDLYVRPEHRGTGLGTALFTALARIARDGGFARFEWAVLDWNTPAIEFYDALGGQPQDDWTTYRLDGDALVTLAARP